MCSCDLTEKSTTDTASNPVRRDLPLGRTSDGPAHGLGGPMRKDAKMKRAAIRHPKTDALMAALGINRREALGLLTMLWDWTGQYAPLGNIGKFPDISISSAVDYQSAKAGKMIDALVSAGWVDRVDGDDRLVIHDWSDHCEEWVRKKLRGKLPHGKTG